MVVVLSWWPLSPLLSPGAAWFIFFNAVVAAIAVMSSCAQQDEHVPSRRRLCRSASSMFLDQLRSFSIFSVHPIAGGDTGAPLDGRGDVSGADYYCCSQEAEVVPAPQLAQACTVAPETPRPTVAGECVPMAARVVPPSAPAATAAADAAFVPESNDEEVDAEEEQDMSFSLDDAYAMAQQRRAHQPPSAPAAAAATAASRTNTAASWPQKKDLAAKARKRRARSGGREAEAAPEGKAELNARAELFIRQFREELKLQRLNSLLSHTHAFSPRGGAPTAAY